MLRTVLAGLRAHARRLVATGLAVILGVGFVAGTLIFDDTATAAFFDTFAREAKGIDVAVFPPEPTDDRRWQPLSAGQVAAVRGLSTVAEVDARVVAPLPLLDARGRVVLFFDSVGSVVSTDGGATLRSFDVQGRVPAAPGEAVLDADTAARQRFAVGDTITVLDSAENRHSYRLTGLIDFASSRNFAGVSVVGLPAKEIATLTGETGFQEIVASARAGVSQEDLVAAVRGVVGADAMVVTGDQRRTDLANEATEVAGEYSSVLLFFGIISLVVAAFVIFNTFAILLAQRVRETGLLRCVGATRRQIFTSVLVESLLLGLAGSVAGIAVGVGIAHGLYALINGIFEAELPPHTVVIGATPVIVGLLLGVGVTVAAAFLPAVRATRTSPLAALRDLPTSEAPSRAARVVRLVLTIAVALVGVVLTWAGVTNADIDTAAMLTAFGGVVTFLAILIGASLFIGPLAAALGALPGRAFGVPVRLAVANVRRNPKRTAVTSATLMVGVGLMALFSVVVSSVRATVEREITTRFPVDYVVRPVWPGGDEPPTMPAGYADAVRARAEFSQVVEVRVVDTMVGAEHGRVAALDPAALGGPLTPVLATGRVADLRLGTAVVSTTTERTRGLRVGDTVEVQAGSRTLPLAVVGTAQISFPGAEMLEVLVSWDQLAAIGEPGGGSAVLATAAQGVPPQVSREALDQLSVTYPFVQVTSLADLSSDLDNVINSLIALIGGLMGVSILISLFGITNTLSLSVVERTRESATVRALGLTRGQLRATLLVEAILMATAGALVGVSHGMMYGHLLVRKMFDEFGPITAIPWSWLASLIALAALAAVLAAVLPARRAARASIVEAMADT